jgi:hypothetical protein
MVTEFLSTNLEIVEGSEEEVLHEGSEDEPQH